MTTSTPERRERDRLTVPQGLAALSLDALASVAYGPEAIVVVLAVAGSHGLGFTLPVTVAIVVLLAALTFSYRQVIAAFPRGDNFKKDFIEAQTCSALKKPHTTFGTVNFDYVHEHDPAFHVPGACARIRNAPWLT